MKSEKSKAPTFPRISPAPRIMKNYTANTVGYISFCVTVCKVSADSRIYNTLAEGPSFQFSCYCLLSTTLRQPLHLASSQLKRTVECFFHTESLDQSFSIFSES